MTLLTVPTSALTGTEVQGTIQARDQAGRNRTSGGDAFNVRIAFAGSSQTLTPADNADGTYSFTFTAPPYLASKPWCTVEVLLSGQLVTSATMAIEHP